MKLTHFGFGVKMFGTYPCRALVDLGLTLFAFVSGLAVAGVVRHPIHAGPVVKAGRDRALIDIHLAQH